MLKLRRLLVPTAVIAAPLVAVLLIAHPSAAPQAAAPAQTKPAAPAAAPAAGKVSSPKDVWGHNVGDDYFLANYKQEYDYFQLLAKQSNRIHIKDIGKSSEGRPMITAIVTDPANYPKLARYQEISRRLSLNQVKDDAEARALAKEGKAVVWIDGGLHASETVGSHQLIGQRVDHQHGQRGMAGHELERRLAHQRLGRHGHGGHLHLLAMAATYPLPIQTTGQ